MMGLKDRVALLQRRLHLKMWANTRRGRCWQAKPSAVLKVSRDQAPAAQLWPYAPATLEIVKDELLAQPISRVPGYIPRAYPLWCEAKDSSAIFVPRMYQPTRKNVTVDTVAPTLSEGEPSENIGNFAGTLRGIQSNAVSATLECLKTNGGGLLSLPCGEGKTVCALSIASQLGRKTLIVVHKTFLLDQWRERISSFLPRAKIGIIQGTGSKPDADCDVVVGMLQTLASQGMGDISHLSKFGTVVVDECHHIGARVLTQAMWRLPAKYLLGLSATPERADGLSEMLRYFIGPISYVGEKRAEEKKVEVQITRLPSPDGIVAGWADYISSLISFPPRNEGLAELIKKHAQASQVLVLSERVSHLQELETLLKKNGTHKTRSIGLYYGGLKPNELKKSADCDIILGTYQMAAEGLDIGGLSTVILATPRTQISQCVGRVLRGNSAVVVDVVDSFKKNNIRMSFYNQEKFTVTYV